MPLEDADGLFEAPGSSEIQRGHTLAAESVERGARADDSSEHPARPAEHCTHKWRQAAVLTRTAQEFGGRGERRSDAVDIAVESLLDGHTSGWKYTLVGAVLLAWV